MKKIAIIGIVGLPANYGGFESFAEQLVLRLQNQFDFTVYCAKKSFAEHPQKLGNINLKYLRLPANGILSPLYDVVSIIHAIFHSDTLLILGVGGCPIIPFLRLFGCRKKLVVNIDGIEWKRAKWSLLAKIYLKFAEWCAVRFSNEVIGDNQVIVDYVQERYNKKCNLIEYGADNTKWEL